MPPVYGMITTRLKRGEPTLRGEPRVSGAHQISTAIQNLKRFGAKRQKMYIDSHAHVEGHKFDSDRAEMLTRAREAGLERILAIGSGTGP